MTDEPTVNRYSPSVRVLHWLTAALVFTALIVGFALANHRTHKPSMLQDRIAGRATEIESINGAIIAVADQYAIPAPALCLLTDMVRLGEGR